MSKRCSGSPSSEDTMARFRPLSALSILTALLAASSFLAPAGAAGPLNKINHVIVIFQENWSFDALYGKFPGANGLANAGATVKQVDKNGQPYATLPQPLDNYNKDRKSTRLNSSHANISYAVFC